MASKNYSSHKDAIYSRRQIEGLIADGRTIIIVEGKVLKVDAWLKFHPGGDKAIMHMVGRDATDEVNALHSPEARQRMDKFQIGKIEGRWTNFVPPIQGGKFRSCNDQAAYVTSESEDEQMSSSVDSSRPSSPLFDTMDHEDGSLRRRRSDDTSISSGSSMSALETTSPDPSFIPKPFFLDARTQEEIVLDVTKYPSINATSQDAIVQKYRALGERLRAEGLFECPYWAYGIDSLRICLFFGLMLLFLNWGWYAVSGLFLGAFWHQLVFIAHDSGHMGITHNFHVDTCIGILISDFLGGLSMGWWKRNHNVHHIVTNSPEHDPDIEHMPFFAISHRFLTTLRSSYYDRLMPYDALAKTTIRLQHYLYYPILTMGRFNLYRLSWEFLLLGQGPRKGPAWWHRYLELAGQVFFWYWFGYGILYRSIPTVSSRIIFIMVSHMVTAPLHVQITLSHFAMSTADLGPHESFPQKMLRTTMDVECPPWLDFFHGGLQFQAIHHLYPRMPKHNLRRAQKLVQEFCSDMGIPYALYGFIDGNKEVIGRLGDVARQAKILAECQNVCAAEGLGVLHGHR